MYASILSQIVDAISTWQIKVLLPPLIKSVQLLIYFLSLLTNDYQYYPKRISVSGGEVYDFIVVGGGTAGCVLANRLTENPDTTVLLIEAGDIPSIASNTPGFFPLLDYTSEEWLYYSTNDGYSSQGLKKKKVHMTAGKLLGGSSGLSYMVYARGAKADYDRWEELGNEGWSWDDVLPYFKISEYIDDMEIYRSNSSSLHGKYGPIKITRPEWSDRSRAYLEGFKQNGRSILLDTNGFKNLGYSMSQFSISDHYRQSTATKYLKPARDRKNLKLLLNSVVRKIIINENKKAVGVEVVTFDGKKVLINAKKEVILCAGALNSPKLLMFSGVGPREHLEENNIKVIVDSPHVGKNFMDTPLVLICITGKEGLLTSFGDNIELFTNLNTFTNPAFIGQQALNKSQEFADYRTNVLPIPPASLVSPVFCSSIFGLSDETCISVVKGGLLKETLFTALAIMHPESRGSVMLTCSDPDAPPDIRTGYYSNQTDLERHALFILDYISVIETECFRSFNSNVIHLKIEQCKNLEVSSLEYWKCYILNTAASMWNFSGTCAMGPEGVVDASLKLRGVKGLRVVDASVIPSLVSGNIQAAVVMIAEKASDMIKADHCGTKHKCN